MAALACLGFGATFVFISEPAAATHWCDPLTLTASPSTGFGGDVASYAVTAHNGGAEALDATLRVRFGWDGTTLTWGRDRIPADASATFTQSKPLAMFPGDYAVTLTVQGEPEAGNETGVAGTCPGAVRTFRVLPLPPPPTVVASALPTNGAAPLEVRFAASTFGGVEPVTVSWLFGDDGFALTANANHTFAAPGVYTAQALARDARGRTAVDRIEIHVAAAAAALSEGRGRDGTTIGVVSAASAVLAALLVAVLVQASRVLARLPQVRPANDEPAGPRAGSESNPQEASPASSESAPAQLDVEPSPSGGEGVAPAPAGAKNRATLSSRLVRDDADSGHG